MASLVMKHVFLWNLGLSVGTPTDLPSTQSYDRQERSGIRVSFFIMVILTDRRA